MKKIPTRMLLKGKKVLLGVCGSIAAYKSAYLVRLLIKEGASVKVLMTHAATNFVTPLTFTTLTKNPVFVDFFSKKDAQWHNHIELASWTDLFLVAPASANTIAKFANGLCDNFLTAVYLSAKCRILIAPTMDVDMYYHPSTTKNIEKLLSYENQIIPPDKGELASGLIGEGRMPEPEIILQSVKDAFLNDNKKKKESIPIKGIRGKKALVTAGPTYEHIDPVRYIGNRSSGKMGFAIAETLAQNGVEVFLISGPNRLHLEHTNIHRINVTTAKEMSIECLKYFKQCDIIVMAAAVADYTPRFYSDKKIKKNGVAMSLDLIRTKDILAELGKNKSKKQKLIGFALETENEMQNARNKLKNKNLDCIVLNSLNDKQAGFNFDTNKVTIIDKSNRVIKSGLKTKKEIAEDIVEKITTLYH